jgi:hypothetical protein
MATLYITEFANLQDLPVATHAQIVAAPALVEQAIAISGTSAQSAAFNAQTRVVRISSDGVVGWTVGTNPTATTVSAGLGSPRLAIGVVEYIGVPQGQNYKIAGITVA